jgi:AcrR family transcriptional regulator
VVTSHRHKAEKLLTSIPKAGRRGRFPVSTRTALVTQAERLFTAQGYAGTSLDEIVARAKVTKGALYHHFSGKQAIFESVFEKVEIDVSRRIRAAFEESDDPWEKALSGLRAFLLVVQDPTYQRVVIQEGPAVLGYERFREQEERSSYAIVQDIVAQVLAAGGWDLDDEMVATFSRIFFGAMSSAGQSVSGAEDAPVAVARVETAITFILDGLRALSEQGRELPDPADLLAREERSDS